MCVAVLVMGVLLVVYIGCQDVKDAAVGMKERLAQQFRDATIAERMEGRIAQAKARRDALKKDADNIFVESEVVKGKIGRLNEGKERTIKSFNDLREYAKTLELPEPAAATPEDMAKTILIGTRTYTGRELYDALREFRTQVEQANKDIEREEKLLTFYDRLAEKVHAQMLPVNNNIAEMERELREYKAQVIIYERTKSLAHLMDDEVAALLNMDGDLEKLREENDRKAAEIELLLSGGALSGSGTPTGTGQIRDDLNRSSFSIYDDLK